MKEKNGLDKSAFQNLRFYNKNFKELKDRKKINQKMTKFIQDAFKCENFTLKQGEMKCKVYWCKVTNKSCNFCNCPKNNDKGVNN